MKTLKIRASDLDTAIDILKEMLFIQDKALPNHYNVDLEKIAVKTGDGFINVYVFSYVKERA